jgi:hypothetical protein
VIEELEDAIDAAPPSLVRKRISTYRHELLVARRMMSATRAAVRRIIDDRVEVGDHALFPSEIELRFADTYETLVRAIEELDIARDLLAGVREHHQSKITENQGEIAKKLTVIASLVLVPSLIVGYFGQNFESAFDEQGCAGGTRGFGSPQHASSRTPPTASRTPSPRSPCCSRRRRPARRTRRTSNACSPCSRYVSGSGWPTRSGSSIRSTAGCPS